MAVCLIGGLSWNHHWLARWTEFVALILGLWGAVFGIAGVWVLGRNRTVFPEPRQGSVLIRHGIYGLVRHPLYTSVMFLAVGWGVWYRSVPALLAAAVLVVFLHYKAQNEEMRLLQRFPDYADYRSSTKRFIPWIF